MISPFSIRNGARPITLFSLMSDFRTWKYRPFGFHLSNVMIHMLNTVLLLFLFRLLEMRPEQSFIAALIYAFHPINGEAVNVPGFRGDLLSVMFMLAGLVWFIYMVRRKAYILAAPVIAVYLLAIASKETAIILPLVLFAYMAVFGRFKVDKYKMAGIVLLMALGIFYMICFWLQRYSYDIYRVIFVNLKTDVTPLTSVSSYINAFFVTLYHYSRYILFPFGLNYDYQISIPMYFSLRTLAGTAVLAALAAAVFRTKDKVLRFCILSFCACYLPASNLLPLFNVVADRYMYMPMLFGSYILYVIGKKLCALVPAGELRIKGSGRVNYRFLAALFVLSVYFGVSFNRNFIYADMLTLYSHTLKGSPGNPRVRYNLAIAYKERDMYDKSIEEFNKTIELHPIYKRDKIWQLIAENYQGMGQYGRAKEYYIKTLLLNPKKETFYGLAAILIREGNLSGSEMLLENLLMSDPADRTARAGLELIEQKRKEKN